MTFELPEPTGFYDPIEGCVFADGMFESKEVNDRSTPLYTEAQLLQVRRDALEEAALICYRNAQSTSGDEIRKLKDETK